MDIYFKLMQYPVFSVQKLLDNYSSIRTARQALAHLVRNRYVERIRNNLYTCITARPVSPSRIGFK